MQLLVASQRIYATQFQGSNGSVFLGINSMERSLIENYQKQSLTFLH
ncbi:hypothetical protein RJ640_027915 [Escallonia rubra]|uniref:Uncharacterized protein n=1 Tax=Escallonia rubra TaxID=112253 RepID=A0AA88RDZ5_9ASTE|nr:hypothetical protein RJ640_027915 [Escallonia rubra]